MMMQRGEPWGTPEQGPADLTVDGDDAALADVVAAHPGTRIRLASPSGSDVARAVGLQTDTAEPQTEVAVDVIELSMDPGGDLVAVNAVVLGPAPDRLGRLQGRRPVVVEVDGRVVFDGRATTVVIATGQYLRGNDLVPRGHPGDGRIEVQVYALDAGQRRPMRERLPTGTHVPHPAIVEASGTRVTVRARAAWPLEIDGRRRKVTGSIDAVVRPAAYRLLV